MAIKNDNHKCIWSNLDLDLEKEFDEGSFEKLIEYSDENELNLMLTWLNRDKSEIRKILLLGTTLLSCFEHTISKDSKNMAAFKLGELSGHLKCLDRILYESNLNDFAKARFEKVKSMNLKYSNLIDNVIKAFSNKGAMITKNELLKKFPYDLQDLEDTLKILLESGFIEYNESSTEYSLTGIGIRLTKQ